MLTPRLRVLPLAQERQAQQQADEPSPLAPRERRRERGSGASDAGSHSSRTNPRPKPYARPPPTKAGRNRPPTLDNILAEAVQADKAKQQSVKPQKKRRQKSSSAPAASTTSTGPPPVLRAVSAARSDASMKTTGGTPMSTTGADPDGDSEEPGARLPSSRGDAKAATPAAADSSDEEGAHQLRDERVSPERRPPLPPAAPLPPPAMGLVSATAALNAALPSDDAANQPPRATRVSDDDRRAMHDARARQAAVAAAAQAAMETSVATLLASPTTSIYDVLMVEYAVQPDAPQEAGAMRADYLKQLFAARQKQHVPRQNGVAQLATMRDVLQRSLALREQACRTIANRKVLYAESVSGLGQLGSIEASPDETLMGLLTRTHLELKPKVGRPSKQAGQPGSLSLRQSRSKGQVTLDWREREHQLRVYAAGKPISYRAVAAVAGAGAMLHIEGLDEAKLSPMTSRTAATMHDEQHHLVQRLCAVEQLGQSPLHVQWDECSKRKKAWVITSLVGSREQSDGSRLREVLAVKALRPDAKDGGKKKSGRNVCRGVLSSITEFFYPEGAPPVGAPKTAYVKLRRLAFINTDFTASNSGKAKGAASLLRAAVRQLSGHFLIFNAPCLSHVVHNECAKALSVMGTSEREPLSKRKKSKTRGKKPAKADDDEPALDEGIGGASSLPHLIPALLDDLVDIFTHFEGLMESLARDEDVAVLRMPATGVQTRWGFYADTAAWFEPLLPRGRLDRGVDFLISHAPRRHEPDDDDGLGDGPSVVRKINAIADEDVRVVLQQLARPEVRAKLMVFEVYGGGGGMADADSPSTINSMHNFLHFTENDGEGVVFKVHWVVRQRLTYLAEQAASHELEEGSPLSEYIEGDTSGAIDEALVLTEVHTAFKAAHKYFDEHVEFLFAHPVYLAFGMMDEHGDGVRTAKELVALAKGQDPMVVFPPIIADYFNSDSRINYTATEISDAIEESSDSPTHLFQEDMWALVQQYANCEDADTLLVDVPALLPLYTLLLRFGRHMPISNFFAEMTVKTLTKTLHPTQRRREATASRWVAALHRDPKRLFKLTDALVMWARGVLGHSRQSRLVPRPSVPDAEEHGSFLGLDDEIDVPLIERRPLDVAEQDDDEFEEAEDDSSDDEAEADVACRLMAEIRTDEAVFESVKQSIARKRANLHPGQRILCCWSSGGITDSFFLAYVLAPPKTAGAWTCSVRWYSEVEDDDYVYEPDKRNWKSSVPLKDIIDLAPPLEDLGNDRWKLMVTAAEPSASTAASAAAKPATSTAAKPTATTAAKLATTTAAKPATTTAAKPALKPKPQPPSTGKPSTETGLMAEVEALLRGVGQLRSDRPILSGRDSEWLNDCQIANDNALAVRPDGSAVCFFYPRDEKGAAQALFESQKMRRLVAALPRPRTSVVLPFSVQQLHWHVIFSSPLERMLYHFEAFGDALPRRSPIALAFQESLGRQGWTLVSMRLHYQDDGSSCGVWIQVARDCWLEYVKSDSYGTSDFSSFMQQRLASEGVLCETGLKGTAKSGAQRANRQYVLTARADMRGRLVQAALAQPSKLSWGQAHLEGFTTGMALDVTEFDDELSL